VPDPANAAKPSSRCPASTSRGEVIAPAEAVPSSRTSARGSAKRDAVGIRPLITHR
jgi:hypothetical protein